VDENLKEDIGIALAPFSDKYYQVLRADYTSGSTYKPFQHNPKLGIYTTKPPIRFCAENPIQISRRAKRGDI